jgi:hypothetical protein
MRNVSFAALAVLALAAGAAGQQQQPIAVPGPDCRVFFTLSVASSGAQAAAFLPTDTTQPAGSVGTSLVIDNHKVGCYGWTVAYTSHGFGSLSLLLQSAPDNSGGTAPGTWASVAVCGGSECLGINPNTAITSAITTTKVIAPWLRMNLTAKSGTGAVVGVLYGYKININAGGGGGSGGACPGGSDTEVQYNSSGNCAGAPDVLYTAGKLTVPVGSITAAGLAWPHTGGGTLGFYKISNSAIGFPDMDLRFIDSGTPTRYINIQPQNIDIPQTIHAAADITWYNAAGPGSGNTVALLSDTNLLFGPFSGGALNTGIVRDNADGVLNVSNAGLTTKRLKLLSVQSTGCTFATIASCDAANNGTASYCSDCTVVSSIDNTCAGSGSGASVERINGAYKCGL